VAELARRLAAAARASLAGRRSGLATVVAALEALSPLATLQRGYAVVRRADDGRVVRSCDLAPPGSRVEVQLAEGALDCRVDACTPRRG
jgi:exodeoxyribonuclease VII large subunit